MNLSDASLLQNLLSGVQQVARQTLPLMIGVDSHCQKLRLISRTREQHKAAIIVVSQQQAGAGEVGNLTTAPPARGRCEGREVGLRQSFQTGGIG